MPLLSLEERTWLGRALRKLTEKMGAERFLCGPILLPSPRHFPDPWSGTVADVHRLTQRLMHHSGLGALSFSLSGFDEDRDAWDQGTAGWFAGIENGRCRFGVHVRQLHDPEAAIGVMAHEVAHAWRNHHGLAVESRDHEELLTDLTTIYLGFGVFTTNNTDRYRSSGTLRETTWSISKAGYLPPPAMAWALALQIAARGDEDEADVIAGELEPNQQAAFRNALRGIENDPSWIEILGLPAIERKRALYEVIDVRDPAPEDIEEPPAEEPPDPQRNAGTTVYRLRLGNFIDTWVSSILPGGVIGAVVCAVAFEDNPSWKTYATIAAAIAVNAAIVAKAHRYVCSSAGCDTRVTKEMAVCPGCGGTLGAKITEGQLRAVREEELERLAAADGFGEECADCLPEEPCERHLDAPA